MARLGLKPTDRAVLFHADDLGLCDGTLAAFAELYGEGLVRSGSLMVPCQSFTQATALRQQCPEADLGLHLTFTCEWSQQRWGPLSKSLPRAEDGGMLAQRSSFWEKVSAAQIEQEANAQITRASELGFHPDHFDCHMFATSHPNLIDRQISLALKHGIPCLAFAQQHRVCAEGTITAARRSQWQKQGLSLFDHLAYVGVNDDPKHRLQQTLNVVEELPAGLSCFLLHPAVDTTQLRQIATDWACRVADYHIFKSPELKNLVQRKRFHLLTYKDLPLIRAHPETDARCPSSAVRV